MNILRKMWKLTLTLYDINWQGNKINIKWERKTSTRILEEGKEKNDEKFDIIYQHMSDTTWLSSCIKKV